MLFTTTSPKQPFRCVYCAYDLSELRNPNADILCPECGNYTDSYNPTSHHIRRQKLALVFVSMFAPTLVTGAIVGFTLRASPILAVFAIVSTYIPVLMTDIALKRSTLHQRKRVIFTIGIGAALGLSIGFGLVMLIN